MKKILLYGNCQAVNAIPSMILDAVNDTYEIIKTKIVVELQDKDINDINKIIYNVDVLISQPIGKINNNYKTSLKYLLSKINNKCKVIIFPVCYFNFYYPDVDYIRINNKQLDKPNPYHDKNIIRLYNKYSKLQNITINNSYLTKTDFLIKEEYNKIINDVNYHDDSLYNELYNKGINELERREKEMKDTYKKYTKNIKFIEISDYIRNNYKEKLLFYSVNHPSKYLLQHISLNILNKLGIKKNINYNLDPLDNDKCILYKSIENNVNFKIKDYKPMINNKNNINEICDLYLNVYKNNKYISDII